MDSKQELAWVGIFVLVASALVLATIFAISGVFGGAGPTYRASLKFAGGLEPGAVVRYAGGPKVGRVEMLRVDPKDASRMEIVFSVSSETPVKIDSKVKIFALGALAENYLELSPGSPQSPLAAPGSALPSEEYISFNDVLAQLNALGPDARKLVQSLNERATELKETITRVNDVINEANRANLASTLSNVRGMIEENRPRVKSTLTNMDAASAKIAPLVDDFKKTLEKLDKALTQVDGLVAENRPDIKAAILDLRKTLASANSLVAKLDQTMVANSENIDEMLENMRLTTANLKQFTDTIKARPSVLLRSSTPADRRPGEAPRP